MMNIFELPIEIFLIILKFLTISDVFNIYSFSSRPHKLELKNIINKYYNESEEPAVKRWLQCTRNIIYYSNIKGRDYDTKIQYLKHVYIYENENFSMITNIYVHYLKLYNFPVLPKYKVYDSYLKIRRIQLWWKKIYSIKNEKITRRK